jgi:hypothetical protein
MFKFAILTDILVKGVGSKRVGRSGWTQEQPEIDESLE